MKELSLNILDIAQNSIKAGAKHLDISLDRRGSWLTVTIADDGVGMSPEFAAAAANPVWIFVAWPFLLKGLEKPAPR